MKPTPEIVGKTFYYVSPYDTRPVEPFVITALVFLQDQIRIRGHFRHTHDAKEVEDDFWYLSERLFETFDEAFQKVKIEIDRQIQTVLDEADRRVKCWDARLEKIKKAHENNEI